MQVLVVGGTGTLGRADREKSFGRGTLRALHGAFPQKSGFFAGVGL
jgi:hypothetical protein